MMSAALLLLLPKTNKCYAGDFVSMFYGTVVFYMKCYQTHNDCTLLYTSMMQV